MIIIRPILHTRRKADGTHAVLICLYSPGYPRKFVPTGLSVAKSHWNENGEIGKLNWVRASRSSHREDNLLLADKIRLLRELSLIHSTPEAIVQAVDQQQPKSNTGESEGLCFKVYWHQYIEDTAHRWGLHWRPKQLSSLHVLSEFHQKPLPFSSLTPQLLTRYEKWHIEKGNAQTTAGKELSQIRAVCHAAVRDKIMGVADNPFAVYTIRHGSGERQALTWGDLQKIEKATLNNFEEQRSRDVFFFQLYAGGRRINEILPLKWTDIEDTSFTYTELKKGGQIVRRRRGMNKELQAILARYEQRRRDGRVFVFPVYEDRADLNRRSVLGSGTSMINNGLYSIADRLGIPRFSSHVARHSWADLARKAGVNIYDISKNLGHSSLTVTENYLATFDQDSAELANEAVLASKPLEIPDITATNLA